MYIIILIPAGYFFKHSEVGNEILSTNQVILNILLVNLVLV